jgi:hypothetical protein
LKSTRTRPGARGAPRAPGHAASACSCRRAWGSRAPM